MTPDQISALASLLALIKTMSGWPFGIFFLLIIVGPWVLALILAYSHRVRFEAVVDMYESNVRLVEKYEELGGDLKDVIILNTETITTLVSEINSNQYCPMVRMEKQAKGVQG